MQRWKKDKELCFPAGSYWFPLSLCRTANMKKQLLFIYFFFPSAGKATTAKKKKRYQRLAICKLRNNNKKGKNDWTLNCYKCKGEYKQISINQSRNKQKKKRDHFNMLSKWHSWGKGGPLNRRQTARYEKRGREREGDLGKKKKKCNRLWMAVRMLKIAGYS